MSIDNEFWRVVASGLWTGLLDDLVAVSERDARARMIENGAFSGKLYRACYDSLSYVVDEQSVQLCWDYIADQVYNPHFREDVPLFVVNARTVAGNTLAADSPPEGYVVYVYSWDYVTFAEVGDLADDNDQPGAGDYVLALVDVDNPRNVGLPSLFLTLTG